MKALRCSGPRATTALCLVLIVGTWLCYRSLSSAGFISFDDPSYVIHNEHVNSGLTWAGIRWAFLSAHASNWHPLTWISHMLDCQLFGLNPAGHHLTNLLFHIVNSVLLFVFLQALTGAVWRSFLVAALFAWHPLHVESVAWVSERKDVLSTMFFLLTLLAYARYVKFKQVAARWYLIALGLFALGLMSKPMLVTLPCVLLLLDFWPLRRFEETHPARRDKPDDHNSRREKPDPGNKIVADLGSQSPASRSVGREQLVARQSSHLLRPLLFEKLPFFGLSVVACLITFVAQRQGGAVSSLHGVPLSLRLANAIVSYPRYILKTVWPANLSIIYPLPQAWPIALVAVSLLFLAFVSWLALTTFRNHQPSTQEPSTSFLGPAWFWFVGTLVPVIGIVQVGTQAMADRYTYIPSIGLFILIVWGLHALLSTAVSPTRIVRTFASCTAALVLASLGIATTRQLAYWKNGQTLFARAIALNPNNYAAMDALGTAFSEAQNFDEALRWYSEAVRIAPDYPQGRFNLGTLLMQPGRYDEAIEQLQMALSLNPGSGSSEALQNLGTALLKSGRYDEAIDCFRRVLVAAPQNAEMHHALGLALLSSNPSKAADAALEFQAALTLNPKHAQARLNLGVALAQLGHFSEAAAQFYEAARLAPNDPATHFNLGMACLDLGRPADALKEFGEGIRLKPADANLHYWFGVAADRLHKNSDAIAHYREALRLNPEFPKASKALSSLLATSPGEDF